MKSFKLSKPNSRLAAILFLFLLFACFPSKKATLLNPGEIGSGMQIKSPTKAFLLDASVILFPRGFKIENGILRGKGQRYWLDREDKNLIAREIPLDSIAALTYYELKNSGGQVFASFLLGIYGFVLTPLSIYCISCPKCCFGSCPTLYALEGEEYELRAELFSYSISKFFQGTDLDLLSGNISKEGPYRIRLSNEALETHYINCLSLIAVNHPVGTRVYPSGEDGFVVVRKLISPQQAVNSLGKNVLPLIQQLDDEGYRSDTTMAAMLEGGLNSDWLDLKFRTPPGKTSIKLVLRLRNTLLSTVLFYDLVLASQGARAVEWTQKMNEDFFYARQFYQLYKAYSGIKVNILREGEWKTAAVIGDVGPIAWKEIALNLPIDPKDISPENEVTLRLEFFPDNFMIDYIAYEAETIADDSVLAREIPPSQIYDDNGRAREDIVSLPQSADSLYLVTNPGESYYFDYDIRKNVPGETSVFLRSQGYYTEWIRGQWLTGEPGNYRFNLFEVDKTITQLRESWLENRELLEREFFKNRIPLREGL